MWAEEIEVSGIPVFVFGDSLNNEVIGFRLGTLKASGGDTSIFLKAIEWATSPNAEDFITAQWAFDGYWWEVISRRDDYEKTLKGLLANKYASENVKAHASEELAKIARRAAKKHHTKRRRAGFQQGRDRLALALIERDGYKCAECGAFEDLTIDHITPLSKGGSDDLDNLWFLCRSHNSKKGDR